MFSCQVRDAGVGTAQVPAPGVSTDEQYDGGEASDACVYKCVVQYGHTETDDGGAGQASQETDERKEGDPGKHRSGRHFLHWECALRVQPQILLNIRGSDWAPITT